MHLVPPPPPKKLSITIVFDFSWDDCNTPENLETMVMQNSEGETRCIMVYVKVVITRGRDVKRALGYLKGNLQCSSQVSQDQRDARSGGSTETH